MYLSLFNLIRLDLSFNELKVLEEETFKHLITLKYLNLAYNQIDFINLFAFSSYTHNLIELDLSNNLILDNSMEFLLFSSLTNLKYLNMDDNQLTSLSNHLFYNLYSLEHLSLKKNKLKSFDIFSLNKNNEFLKIIDLSFNKNLKFDKLNQIEDTSNLSKQKYANNVQILNLAGIDLAYLNMEKFLNSLFDQYKNLRVLNMSLTRIKSVMSNKWPSKIEIIDLSFNLIKDTQFDCSQLSSIERLEFVYLNNNNLKSFKKFIESCSKGFGSKIQNKSSGFTIDVRNNFFETLDSIQTSKSNQKSSNSQAESSLSLLLDGNQLVCNCENNWWSNIGSSNTPNLFYAKDLIVSINDYESLSCVSEQTNENEPIWSPVLKFKPIRNHIITPNLVCPYKFSCSPKTCECCEFRECDCSFNCPKNCKCSRDYQHSFDIVDCTSVSLNSVPLNLPTLTTEMLLSNNNLKRLQPYQFFGRFRVNKIDLSRNQLGFIEENSFHGLTQLITLSLSYNHLQILLGYEFRELILLEYLYLNNNRIQFISNTTFVNLVNLKTLNLEHNNLRHVIEKPFYFKFNINLVNLTMDMIKNEFSLDIGRPMIETDSKGSKQNSSIAELTNRLVYYAKDNSNMSYLNLIREFLGRKTSLNTVKCIFEKLKQALLQNAESKNKKIESLNLLDKASDDDFKFVLAKYLNKFKSSCLNENNKSGENINKQNEEATSERVVNSKNKSKSIVYRLDAKDERLNEEAKPNANVNHNNNDYVEYYNSLNSYLKAEKANSDDKKSMHEKSPFVLLNYTTIIGFSAILIIIIIVFSILISLLLIKIDKNNSKYNYNIRSNKKHDSMSCVRSIFFCIFNSLRSRLNSSFNASLLNNKFANGYENNSSSANYKPYNQIIKREIAIKDRSDANTKNKILNFFRFMGENRKQNKTIKKQNNIYDSVMINYDKKSSSFFYTNANKTLSPDDCESFESTHKNIFQIKQAMDLDNEYDVLICYNQNDKNLVENVIAPILLGYNLKIVLQHKYKANIENTIRNKHQLLSLNENNKSNKMLQAQLIDLVHSSSFVLFILTKNLFSETEYRLSIETPEHKKLVLLADDVNDAIAESLLQTKQILREKFNLENFTYDYFKNSSDFQHKNLLKYTNKLSNSHKSFKNLKYNNESKIFIDKKFEF